MPTLTIKGIPEPLYRLLKAAAGENRRSLNAEVIHRLERSVAVPRMSADEVLARIDRLHAGGGIPPVDEELLRHAKEEGRP